MHSVSLRTAALCLLCLAVAPASLHARATVLPRAVVRHPYETQLPALQGNSQCVGYDLAPFELVTGELPEGLAISAMGKVSGVPVRIGSERFAVRLRNQCTERVVEFSLEVSAAPVLSLTPPALTLRGAAHATANVRDRFAVAGTWPELPFLVVQPPVEWLKVRRLGGVTPAADAAFKGDSIEIEADPRKLPPGTFTTSIRVLAREAANAPELHVTFVVTDDSVQKGIQFQ